MRPPYFFGYGSLVNRQTHTYSDAHRAQITGWRRTWRHIEAHQAAFLVVEPCKGCTIDGLIAAVPGADWDALDAREAFYARIAATDVAHPLPKAEIQLYHSPLDMNVQAANPRPILLSYLDVVVQGYHTEYGEGGVDRFFATTDGWEAPVLNDRVAPKYPRHQVLARKETALVDRALAQMGTQILPL